ncbi:hypothetical protein FQZ97_934890 [compost metagenome]
MRACATSCMKSSGLFQRRTTPGSVALVVLSTGSGPLRPSAFSTVATVPARMQCAQGYSGCIGVSISGAQLASRSVPSWPSRSPLRIAVTGRQKLWWYLASTTAIRASSMDCATTAKSRALASTSRPGCSATERTTPW